MKRYAALVIILICALSISTPGTQAQDAASDLFGRVNNLRASLGLSPYSRNAALNIAAQNQAAWMASTGEISHFRPDGTGPRDRANAAGYSSSWVSENIYMGSIAGAGDAWNFWINSPIHYRGLTNANYQDIGIGVSSGANGSAFVLVFGNPGGSFASSSASSSSGSGSSGARQQPPYVVGVDNHGNIMHEIQPGHTLGDIALIYGYTWDDIPAMLELNGLTEDDARLLEIGTVFLVPPHSGTYTPTPEPNTDTIALDDNTSQGATPTEPPSATPQAAQPTVYAPASMTPTAQPGSTAEPTLDPAEAAINAAVNATLTALAVGTATPQPGATESVTEAAFTVRSLPSSTPFPTPLEVAAAQQVPPVNSGPSPVLIVAVLIQIGILSAAGIEFIRRMRR